MVATRDMANDRASFRFGDVCPSAAAHEELRWYYNDWLADLSPGGAPAPRFFDAELAALADEARFADVMLANELIGARLGELQATERKALEALYDERPTSPCVLPSEERCGAAIQAYDRARGNGPSVVPARNDERCLPRWCRSYR
jgi:hypothetical protein